MSDMERNDRNIKANTEEKQEFAYMYSCKGSYLASGIAGYHGSDGISPSHWRTSHPYFWCWLRFLFLFFFFMCVLSLWLETCLSKTTSTVFHGFKLIHSFFFKFLCKILSRNLGQTESYFYCKLISKVMK